jgi:tetratricopeptide (TPR) repeat protein
MTREPGAAVDAALERGDFSEATLGMVKTLIAREPREIGWWIAAERCLVALGRHDEAERALDGACAIDPHSGVVASRRVEFERLRRIREYAERLLAESPERLRVALGEAHDNDTQHDFQVEGRRLLVALDPTDVGALCALGGAQRGSGQPRVALASYRKAEALADADARAMSVVHVGVAAVMRDIGEAVESRRLYEDVLAIDRNNGHAMLGLVALHLDEAERTRSPAALAAAKSLLGVLWMRGERTPKVQAAYRRLHSLSG